MSELDIRIKQVMGVLDKENRLLSDVSERLFSADKLDINWFTAFLRHPENMDKLESFSSKFCRMQDTFMDKLTPLLLKKLGELSGSAIDNLNKLERLDIIKNANDWLAMRLLRNKLVHEYVDDLNELLTHLLFAKTHLIQLHNGYTTVQKILAEQRTK